MGRRRRQPSLLEAMLQLAVFVAPFVMGIVLLARFAEWSRVRIAKFVASPAYPYAVGGMGLAMAALGYLALHRRQRYWRQVRRVSVDDHRDAYVIEDDDYRRGNPKEHLYRKMFQLRLLEAFGNRCARCGHNDNGVDLDHFFLSKNEGGCFIMRHRNGHLVNNAVPLCQRCNRSKSDRPYRQFYEPDALLELLKRNARMTEALNAETPLDAQGRTRKPARRAA